MKTIISIGHGRLHLIQTAQRIAAEGVDVKLVCGWVPNRADSVLVRFAGWILRRNLIPGMKKRKIEDFSGEVCTCFFAEAMNQILSKVFPWLCKLFRGYCDLGWSLFGLQSRAYIRDADIFHVRSGAGQGGAIRKAKRLGMKVLVDHSCLHPQKCVENMGEDYKRWGMEMPICPGRDVWINVENDCRMADVIMVNAEHIKDSFIAQGYDGNRIRVNYLGVREDFWSLKKEYQMEGKLKILFTGNFSILKGAEYIVKAIMLMVEHGYDIELDVVGEVSIPTKLNEMIKQLPITLYGSRPQDDLKKFLSEADLYLFPSLGDGCASSGMEALAAGLCVVATKASGLPIEDAKTGYIVPIKDAHAIARKIEWLHGHRGEMERVGKAASEMMRSRYTWRRYAANIINIYNEMLSVR